MFLWFHSGGGFNSGEGCVSGGLGGCGGGGREFMDITALLVASQHGHEAAVRLLLEWGSDVNFSQKTTGWGALMLATLSGKVGWMACEWMMDRWMDGWLHRWVGGWMDA